MSLLHYRTYVHRLLSVTLRNPTYTHPSLFHNSRQFTLYYLTYIFYLSASHAYSLSLCDATQPYIRHAKAQITLYSSLPPKNVSRYICSVVAHVLREH